MRGTQKLPLKNQLYISVLQGSAVKKFIRICFQVLGEQGVAAIRILFEAPQTTG